MILRHALLAAVISGIAATASAQTTQPSTTPGQPARTQTQAKNMPAPAAADAAKLIGRSVKNSNNDTIGKVESVYLDANGKVDSVIVGVGGFLGVGERYARLNWKDLQVSDNGERVVLDMTKDQLKAQAPYKYKDDAMRGHVFSDRGVWKDDSRASADTRRTGETRAATTSTESTGDFNAQGDVSANAVIGAKVRNANKDTVGTVQDVYVDGSGTIKSVVLAVGGFLGVGSKDVAVQWSDLKQTRDGKSVMLTTSLDKDQLKSMPDYKYERLQRHHQRPPRLLLPGAGAGGRGPEDQHHRGHGRRREAAPAAEEVRRDGRAPVRHLHPGLPGGVQGAAGAEPEPDRDRGPLLAGRQSLPLHRLRQDHQRGHGSRRRNERSRKCLTVAPPPNISGSARVRTVRTAPTR
jgi:sporulation protein YlmC with PRC-barrel domain